MLRRMMMAGAAGGGTDPYWANVVSLLHFDGADGSTTFTDQKGHVWTPSGSAQIDTGRVKYGTAAGLFATSDRIDAASHSDFGFGTGDLCFEAWCYFDSLFVTPRVMGNLAGSGWGANRWVLANGSNRFQFYAYNYNTGSPLLDSSFTRGAGWEHIAITRSGSTWRMFSNGELAATATFSGSLDGGGSQTFHVGGSGAPIEFYNGSVDELRITKGVARYTANFTPPSAPFPNS